MVLLPAASGAPADFPAPPSRQDTVTGFLLAGVGNVDLRKKSNFLIVDSSALPSLFRALPHALCRVCRPAPALCPPRGITCPHRAHLTFSCSSLMSYRTPNATQPPAVLATCSSCSIRRARPHPCPFPPPLAETTVRAIEAAFKEFTTRDDIAIILISQSIAEMIRHIVDRWTKPVPAILEM